MTTSTATAPAEERKMTETEAYAIAADRVVRETAELTSEVTRLTAEMTELQSRFDVEVSTRTAAEAARDEAIKKHEDFVTDLDAKREAASKKDERIAKIREAAAHLKDEFFADEARVGRITAMDDAQFDGYLADLRETAALAPKAPAGGAPRETAMSGSSVTGSEAKVAPAASGFLLGAYTKEA